MPLMLRLEPVAAGMLHKNRTGRRVGPRNHALRGRLAGDRNSATRNYLKQQASHKH